MERIDQRRVEPWPGAILAFSCVRNEALRLPYFLDYHRALGVDLFLFVDNGSTDGTRELLLAQEDALVFAEDGSYAASHCGMDWIHALLARYGPGHWILTLEPDELLVYPGCEHLGLKPLTRLFDDRGIEAMKTFLVDMYADVPIRETGYRAGEPFLGACPWFDGDGYFGGKAGDIPCRGGPRHRLFWEAPGRPGNSPFLNNVPLVRWREGLAYSVGTHLIPSVTPGPLTGAKLHFKFLQDFPARAAEEAARKEHWDGAAQYQAYSDVLSASERLCAVYPGSLRYRGSMQLVDLGLMRVPADWPVAEAVAAGRAEGERPAIPGRVSVIVPFHGVEPWIGACLDSVQAQTHADIEILCVDDASPDGCAAIVADRARADPRIRLLSHGHNRGLGGARNTGLHHASGEYVCFVDSDDTVAVDYVERLHRATTAHDADVGVAGMWMIEDGQRKAGHRNYRAAVLERAPGLHHFVDLLNLYRPTACAKLFRRSLLSGNGIRYPEGRYYEDVSFWLQVARHARRVVVIPDRIYDYWSDRPGSIMNSLRGKHIEDRLHFLRRFARLLHADAGEGGIDDDVVARGAAEFVGRHVAYGFTLIDTLQPADAPALERQYLAGLQAFAAEWGWADEVSGIIAARAERLALED